MSELRFDGKVAIVTGAGRGMGRSHALLLASRGASVVVNDPGVSLAGDGGDKGPAQQVVDEIVAAGGKAVANFESVASAEGGQSMVRQALDSFGGLHILVNNAGNFTDSRPFLETSTESFESLFQVHVMGTVHLIRAAWQHLLDQKYGRIVNIGSHGGYYGHGGKFEYATVKAGIHGLTLSLAMEGRQYNVACNVVAPGAATRPVMSWAKPGTFDKPAFSPDLVAPAVAWLVHEDCPANGDSFSVIAGNISRVGISETKGYQSTHPTPESIRDRFADIMNRGESDQKYMVFPTGAIERGMELVAAYEKLG